MRNKLIKENLLNRGKTEVNVVMAECRNTAKIPLKTIPYMAYHGDKWALQCHTGKVEDENKDKIRQMF